jgi:hypothetical protein
MLELSQSWSVMYNIYIYIYIYVVDCKGVLVKHGRV